MAEWLLCGASKADEVADIPSDYIGRVAWVGGWQNLTGQGAEFSARPGYVPTVYPCFQSAQIFFVDPKKCYVASSVILEAGLQRDRFPEKKEAHAP